MFGYGLNEWMQVIRYGIFVTGMFGVVCVASVKIVKDLERKNIIKIK